MLTETEKSYIAGIIDGEGTITLSKRRKNEMPSPVISVSSTDLEVLHWLRTRLGGIICTKKKYKTTHKQSYTWYIKLAGKCLNLLNDIELFLIIKRPHALLLLKDYKNATPRNGKYDSETLCKKLELINKIRILNKH